jgi:hypothetical protein
LQAAPRLSTAGLLYCCTLVLQEHDFEVVAAAFSHDSRLLATIGNEQ